MDEINMDFEELLQSNSILVKSVDLTKKLAKENNSIPFYKEHFIPCANICYEMSYIKNLNKIDCILVGLFHDVGKFMLKGQKDNHEIIGAEFAERFLENSKYEKYSIYNIKQAIMDHRKNANDNLNKMSKLAIDADIISYIIHKQYFYDYLLSYNTKIEASKIVEKKIMESYGRMDEDGKIMLDKLLKG